MHEQSETIQGPNGWINVYGRGTPKAGQQLPGTLTFPTVEAAVSAAGARSANSSTFDVDVGGTTYEVDAPDERTAWKWANAIHNKAQAAAPVESAPVTSTTAEKIAAHPVTRFAVGAGSLGLGLMQLGARNPIGKVLGQDKWIDDKINTLAAMAKAGGHEGYDWAGLAGAVASPAAALTKVPLAATRMGRIGQGAGIGAAVGAATPVTESDDFGIEKAKQIGIGGAIGPVMPAVIGGVAKGAEAVRNVVDPWLPGGIDRLIQRTANKAAGSKREQVIDELRSNREIVPGSRAAAGEVAAPAGSAEFSALQRIVEPLKPTAYREASKGQDAARLTALRTVGQDKTALEAAISKRADEAATNYGEAGAETIKADDILRVLLKRPSMEKILGRASDLAEERGQKFIIGKDVAETVVPGRIVDQTGKAATSTTIPAQSAQYPVNSLHYMKMAMDDLIKNPERFGIGASEVNAINGTRNYFISWLAKKSPAYDFARAEFAKASKPINQMQVGQYLESKLVPALNDSGATANQRGALYAGAVRDAPGTLKRATGFSRYEDIAEVLSPQQMQTVRSVGQDLGRKAEYEDLAKRGSVAARNLVADQTPKVPAAGMFNPKYSVARAILNRLEGKISGKALEELAVKMQDPKEMARIMARASPAERKALMEEAFQLAGRGSSVLGATAAARQQQSQQP